MATPFVLAKGVDSIKLAWRTDQPVRWDAVRNAHHAGRIAIGPPDRDTGVQLLANRIGGGRWTIRPQSGLISCDARLVELIGSTQRLAPLGSVELGARRAILAFGEAVGEIFLDLDPRVRRCDVSLDIVLSHALGCSVIRRVFEAEARRRGEAAPYFDPDGPKSSRLGGKRRKLIAYKKGEYADAMILRLERQNRYEDDRPVDAIAGSPFMELFASRLSKELRDAPPLLEIEDAMATAMSAAVRGELTMTRAAMIAGDAYAIEQVGLGGPGGRWNGKDQIRHGRRKLRKAGIEVVESAGRCYCRPNPALTLLDVIALGDETP
ncbi:MAG: hypothetical protein U0R70_17520 [Solirubrobacteraceae bacterium]